jgi:predicted RNA binding protein YcfA (HicA-like mRNA interferase family)
VSHLPSLKRNAFLRVLSRLGVTCEEARAGGSLVKLSRGAYYDSFHVHPSEEVGPRLAAKVLRRLGIDPEDFRGAI